MTIRRDESIRLFFFEKMCPLSDGIRDMRDISKMLLSVIFHTYITISITIGNGIRRINLALLIAINYLLHSFTQSAACVA